MFSHLHQVHRDELLCQCPWPFQIQCKCLLALIQKQVFSPIFCRIGMGFWSQRSRQMEYWGLLLGYKAQSAGRAVHLKKTENVPFPRNDHPFWRVFLFLSLTIRPHYWLGGFE